MSGAEYQLLSLFSLRRLFLESRDERALSEISTRLLGSAQQHCKDSFPETHVAGFGRANYGLSDFDYYNTRHLALGKILRNFKVNASTTESEFCSLIKYEFFKEDYKLQRKRQKLLGEWIKLAGVFNTESGVAVSNERSLNTNMPSQEILKAIRSSFPLLKENRQEVLCVRFGGEKILSCKEAGSLLRNQQTGKLGMTSGRVEKLETDAFRRLFCRPPLPDLLNNHFSQLDL